MSSSDFLFKNTVFMWTTSKRDWSCVCVLVKVMAISVVDPPQDLGGLLALKLIWPWVLEASRIPERPFLLKGGQV